MRAHALKPSALPQKLKPLSLGLERVQKILNVEFLVEIAAGLWTGREQHLSGMTCVFSPSPPCPSVDSAVFVCSFSCISTSSALVLVSLEGPFLLGCQGFCSQPGPIRSILLFLLPQSTDPFQYIWDDLQEEECVVSGEVWAEEQSLLVERILVSQELLEQRACSEWHLV